MNDSIFKKIAACFGARFFSCTFLRYFFSVQLVVLFLCSSASVYGAIHHVSSISEANTIGSAGDIVYIAGGTYSETLRPSKNGNASAGYITYRPEPDTVVTISGVDIGINLNSRSYIRVDGLRLRDLGKARESGNRWINIEFSAHHIIIENCTMDRLVGAWSGVEIGEKAHHIKLINNTLRGHCPCNSYCIGEDRGGPHDLINISNAHHVLVDGNSLYNALHSNISVQDNPDGSTSYCIIRNNYSFNKWHSNFDIWSPEYMLAENNTVYDAGENHEENYCSRSINDLERDRAKHKGIHVNDRYSIIRYNVIVNNGTGLEVTSSTDRSWKNNAVSNRLYNNTVVANQEGVYKNAHVPAVDNIHKNSIFYNSVRTVRTSDGNGPRSTNQYISNNMYGGREPSSFSPDDIRKDNVSVDPEFVNAEKRNYNLKSGSPMINAGTWLTTTRSSGSGSTIPVYDARYFMDGWGLIEGDVIQFQGQTNTYKVIDVNYSGRSITIQGSASWAQGVGISLPYKGSRPDMGAFEYDENPAPVDVEITTASLPVGKVGLSYSITLSAKNGSAPYTWSIISGSLPDGLGLDSNGVISGVPEAVSGSTFTVQVTDASGSTDEWEYTMTIQEAWSVINLAAGKTAVNVGTPLAEQTGYEPDKAIDGDPDTRWAVKPKISSLQVDLGAVFSISSTEVVSFASRGYQFTVSVSTDGSVFTQIVDESSTSEQNEVRSEFTATDARYVRLNVTGSNNYDNNYTGIVEFRVFGPDVVCPAAPTDLVVTGVSSGSIDLHWTDNADDEGEYVIEQSTNGSDFSRIVSLDPDTQSYTVDGLSASTTYYFRVYAGNLAGESEYSNIVSGNTLVELPNVALGKTAYTSGTIVDETIGFEADRAIDGDLDTRWAVKPKEISMEVDLEAMYSISATEVLSYNSRGYQFTISVSEDGTSFTQIVDESATTEQNALRNEFAPVTARYVRLNITGSNNYDYNYTGIEEFRIFGEEVTVVPVIDNLAQGKTVTHAGTSDLEQEGYEPGKAVDGDPDTRWAVKPLVSSIEVDLGAVYTINAAEVLSYAGRGYQFTISVSTDGSTFTQVVDESDTTEPDITRSEFSAIEARYVRLNLTGAYNYTNNFSGITEFRIFGYTDPVSSTNFRSEQLIFKPEADLYTGLLRKPPLGNMYSGVIYLPKRKIASQFAFKE